MVILTNHFCNEEFPITGRIPAVDLDGRSP